MTKLTVARGRCRSAWSCMSIRLHVSLVLHGVFDGKQSQYDFVGDFAKYKKHLKNVGPIRHCEPPHAACFTLPFTRCRYCRTPPLSHAVKIAEMLQFLVFSRWPPPPSWFFEIAKFYWLLESKGSRCTSMPNFFFKIGQSVAKILRFFNFSRWRPSAILDLFEAYLDHQQ